MNDDRRRSRARRLLLLLALAGAFVVALAAAPQAGALIILTQDSTLNIGLAGTGTGQVGYTDDANAPVTCPPTCSTLYDWLIFFPGPQIQMTASASAGSTFGGWSVNPAAAIVSGCGAAVTCTVDMDANDPVNVTATFNAAPNLFPLAVLKTGSGQGTVTSNPAGIDCGATCATTFTQGTVVTLTATPAAGSTFGGWSGGGCTGTGTCQVTMNAAQTVTATFNTQTFPLTTVVQGNGAVTSSPQGIACQPTCTAQFPSGTQVTLTPNPQQGYVFQGFSGACTGTGPCTVSMTQAQNVTATFAPGQVQASVVSTRITKTGPAAARRQLRITVNAEQDLARIVFRIRRGGVTLQSRTVRNFDADTAVVVINIRNGIPAGRAQLQTTFRNEAGTQKVQTRGIRIPSVF